MTRLALALLLLALPAQAGEIRGTATAVDGDTVRIDGQRVRLCGINAPETSTRAGKRARAAMSHLVDGERVTCVPVGSGTPCDGLSRRSSYERPVAQCFVGDVDIAAMMVARGHAADWPRYSGGNYEPCEVVKDAPTDANLYACLGDIEGGSW